jgi:phospholipid/cholesterol/gamma-HCH transport system substrate-binding protein
MTKTRPRIAAIAVLVVAAVAAAFVLAGGGQPYTVTAKLQSASQLVKGNEVTVAGKRVGTVRAIRVTADSQAEVELTIDDDAYTPLRTGTRAIVRQLSVSGQANRYIDLQLGGANGAKIDDGGAIPAKDVAAAVELDELFDIFDQETRPQIKRTIKGLSEFGAGRTDEANAALQYLNPALSSSSRLFAELTRDRPALERFIVQTARLTGDLAARDEDLAGVVDNLGQTMQALSAERDDLGDAVERLPTFLRRTNSTFVNLRATLGDLDPLVADARPVVRNDLRPLFAQLRPFAADAGPTLRDLSQTIQASGRDNDLVDLLNTQPAVDRIATQSAQRNGKERPGAFAETRRAVNGAIPQVAFLRPYANDLVGWFDDFSTSGLYDALGSFSRAGLELNGMTLDPGAGLLPVPPELRKQLLSAGTVIGRNNRCPGSAERQAPDRTNPYRPSEDYPCDPKQVPPGR